MEGSKLARWAPATGIVFAVLTAISFGMGLSGSPDFAGSPATYLSYYRDQKSEIILACAIGLVAMVFLIWFLGTVSSMLGRTEGGDRRVAVIGVVGGAIGAVSWLGGLSAWAMPALRLDEQGKLSTEFATVFGDLSNVLLGMAAPVGFGALLLAAALLGFRAGAIPTWLTWVSLLGGLVMVFPWTSFIGIFLFPVWVLVVAMVELVKSRSVAQAAT